MKKAMKKYVFIMTATAILCFSMSYLTLKHNTARDMEAHLLRDNRTFSQLENRAELSFLAGMIVVIADGNLSEEEAYELAEAVLEAQKLPWVDLPLLLGVIEVESNYQPSAISPKGARGLMQVTDIAVKDLDLEYHEPLDSIRFNVMCGALYLNRLHDRFNNRKLALAAYNIGPTVVGSSKNQQQFAESRYVKNVLSARERFTRLGLG